MNDLERLGAILKRFLESDNYWNYGDKLASGSRPWMTLDGRIEITEDEVGLLDRLSAEIPQP